MLISCIEKLKVNVKFYSKAKDVAIVIRKYFINCKFPTILKYKIIYNCFLVGSSIHLLFTSSWKFAYKMAWKGCIVLCYISLHRRANTSNFGMADSTLEIYPTGYFSSRSSSYWLLLVSVVSYFRNILIKYYDVFSQ